MTISVIITTYNRGGHLRRCLPSLLGQKVNADEIIIVDDGSEDYTKSVVEQIQKDFPKQDIKYIYNNNIGYTNCCLAKNIGLRQAKGDILVFTEPEILHATETLQQHLAWQEKGEKTYISAGTVYFVFGLAVRKLTLEEMKKPKLITEKKSVKEWIAGYKPEEMDIAVSRHVTASYCASVRRKRLMEVGGWDERFIRFWGWDDIDLQSRLGRNGMRTISDPTIEMVHLAHGYTGCFEVWHYNKKMHDDPNKPIVANQGKEWGVIRE